MSATCTPHASRHMIRHRDYGELIAMREYSFAVLGGDMRGCHLAEAIRADGLPVQLFGFDKLDTPPDSPGLAAVLAEADVVLGATPCCAGSGVLNTPFHDGCLTADVLAAHMRAGQSFIAGRIPVELAAALSARGIRVFDILEREEMAVLNAIPTAEGAVQLAMERLPITLHGADALILGYGRIGKILAKMLQGIGSKVYVAARKLSDAALLRSYGHIHVPFDALDDSLGRMDVIFNTVPHILLDQHNLRFVRKDCVLIDMASRPFGIDVDASRREGLEVVWAPSLPGKAAPVTAAQYIYETVQNILREGEELV